MVTQRFVTIGYIHKSVGVHGEVLADVTVPIDAARIGDLTVWIIPPPLGFRGGRIRSMVEHSNLVKIRFEGVDSVEQAKPLAQTDMVVELDALDPQTRAWVLSATQDPHGSENVIGFEVTDERYGALGSITDTIETGANDVWVVEGPYGQVLIPVIDQVVITVDCKRATIEVRVLPGLIEEDPR